MRFPADGPVSSRVGVLVCGLVVAGVAGALVAGLATSGPDGSEAVASPTPPPGADDSLNRPVFVEGGVVLRGSENEGKSSDPASPFYTGDEDPVRPTRVASFWMQRHEVTNREYRRFDPAHDFPSGRDRHPVVHVSWREAMAYAASVGGRLPTEAEWELAAEGTENRMFPWGDTAPTCDRAHYSECGPPGTIEVTSRPSGATPSGIHDLAGNVWEWVMPAWFEPDRMPVNDETRRMRGGSFAEGPFFLRASNRNNDFFRDYRSDAVGFRVVWPGDGDGF